MELGFSSGNVPEALAAHLPASRLGADIRAERRRDEIVNQPAAGYRFNYFDSAFTGHDDGSTKKDLKSQSLHGARPPRGGKYEMDWIRDLTTVRAIQDVLMSMFKNGPRIIEYTDATLRNCLPLELEDFVGFSSDFVEDEKGALLKNQVMQVIGKSVDMQSQRITLRLLDTGGFLATANLADGTCIADGSCVAGGSRDTTVYA